MPLDIVEEVRRRQFCFWSFQSGQDCLSKTTCVVFQRNLLEIVLCQKAARTPGEDRFDPHIVPTGRRAALKPTSPWYFEEFLSQNWKDGIRTGSALFRLIRERGYEGSQTHLQRLLAGWRRAEKQAKGPAVEHKILELVRDPETGHAISPVIAAALCIKPRGKLTPDQARKVDALKAGSPAFATMRCLAMRFNGILRGREADPLPAWIDDAIETDLAPIVRFARTLNRDFDAVKNAVEMPWSNGQAEGQINRLKTLKRAMYGRAGPELLRARMLPFRHTD